MNKCIILDFNRTVYDPETEGLVDGAVDFLNKYMGHYKLALISKGDRQRRQLIEKLELKKFFDYIEIIPKKTQASFEKCLKDCQCAPQMAWLIGDRARVEIKIAKKMGMNTIWLRRGKFENEQPESEEYAPHFQVTSFLMASKLVPLGLG